MRKLLNTEVDDQGSSMRMIIIEGTPEEVAEFERLGGLQLEQAADTESGAREVDPSE